MPGPQQDQVTEITGNRKVKPRYTKQSTLQYKTFLKRMISEALQNAFDKHPDTDLAKTKIGVDYRTDRADFPQIIVKFYEKSIENAGVGHSEWGPVPSEVEKPYKKFIQYQHQIYKGDLEFEIWALSTVDRDKLVDALIEVLVMSEVSSEGLNFQKRIYKDINATNPYSDGHFVALNTDDIKGYGEQQGPVPWLAEDVISFQTSYRISMLGEFYSPTPTPVGGTELLEEIDIYPWDEADPKDTPPESFPEGIIPEEDYIKIRRRKKTVPVPIEKHGLETSPTLETEPPLETEG